MESRNLPIFSKNRVREVKDVQKTVGRKTESYDRFGPRYLNSDLKYAHKRGENLRQVRTYRSVYACDNTPSADFCCRLQTSGQNLERVLRRISLRNLIPEVRLKSGKMPIHKETYFKANPFKYKSGSKSGICLHTFTRRICMRLILRQLTGNSQTGSNDGMFDKTGGETVVLVSPKLLLHVSTVNSHHSYINHFFIISHRRSEIKH
jgi:hypothetical protein